VLRDARERLVRPGGVFAPHRSATTAVALDLDRANGGEPVGFPSFTLTYVQQIFTAIGRPFDLRVCLVGLQDNPPLRDQAYLSTMAEVEPLDALLPITVPDGRVRNPSPAMNGGAAGRDPDQGGQVGAVERHVAAGPSGTARVPGQADPQHAGQRREPQGWRQD
jgi:hypothetical protein